jgi:hypothetical protein
LLRVQTITGMQLNDDNEIRILDAKSLMAARTLYSELYGKH